MIRSGKSYGVPLLLMFLINPFFTVVYIINRIANGGYSKWYPILISLFFGLLATTQYAPNADLNRSYHNMLALGDFSIRELALYLLIDKYILYTIINYLIYIISGNVQLTSLLWGSCIYYFIFLSFENLKEYYKETSNKYNLLYFLSSIFCFVMFVEVMETMKQAVGFSMFLYSFTSFLNHKYKRCLLVLALSIGVHMSQLMLLPFFLCRILKFPVTLILTVLSFSFRAFNLMSLVNSVASLIGLEVLTYFSMGYIDQSYDNFTSNAPYFILTYAIVVLFALFYIIIFHKKDSAVANVALLYIIVLNFNYSNNHNYTRILLHSFPYWILLLFSIMNTMKSIKYRSLFVSSMLFLTFFLQFWFSYGRFGTNENEYQTSFMGNSVISIMTSTVYGYINYKVPVD